TIDYLVHQVRLPIVAEIIVPIEQHLLLNKGFTGTFQDITEVYSHSHAIAQCHQFIHKELTNAKIKLSSSTGKAAELVAKSDQSIAAIGNILAAKEYDLQIAKHNIHDYENNHTRFAVLAKNREDVRIHHQKETEKTTLLITLPTDHPGALHQVLSAFSW